MSFYEDSVNQLGIIRKYLKTTVEDIFAGHLLNMPANTAQCENIKTKMENFYFQKIYDNNYYVSFDLKLDNTESCPINQIPVSVLVPFKVKMSYDTLYGGNFVITLANPCLVLETLSYKASGKWNPDITKILRNHINSFI